MFIEKSGMARRRVKGHLTFFVLSALLALVTPALTIAQTLPTKKLTAGMHVVTAEVAANEAARMKGLMFRESLEPNHGMLFVFEQPNVQCFWMKNTLLPLTAAFIADDGTIVNLADMKPQTLDSHCSSKPVRFVLEMNQGWFQKKGLKAGSQLAGPVFSVKH